MMMNRIKELKLDHVFMLKNANRAGLYYKRITL